MKRDAPPVIFTDDCWIFTAQASVTAADLKTKVVDGYADTGGALWWSIGDHEVYLYETEIGELFGADNDALDPTSPSFVHSATPGIERLLAANVRQLIAASGGPLPTDADLGPTLTIRVSDEIQEITGSLTLRLQNLAPDDRLEVRLNSHTLSWDRAQVNFDGWVRQQVATLFWANYPTYP